jgi:hypothetical protein
VWTDHWTCKFLKTCKSLAGSMRGSDERDSEYLVALTVSGWARVHARAQSFTVRIQVT